MPLRNCVRWLIYEDSSHSSCVTSGSISIEYYEDTVFIFFYYLCFC